MHNPYKRKNSTVWDLILISFVQNFYHSTEVLVPANDTSELRVFVTIGSAVSITAVYAKLVLLINFQSYKEHLIAERIIFIRVNLKDTNFFYHNASY